MNLKDKIRTKQDFPLPGIRYRDITTLLKDPQAYRALLDDLCEPLRTEKVDLVIGPEARGFVIGAPMAYMLGAGFVPVRRPGKLPAEVYRYEYALGHGRDTLEIHQDAVAAGQRVVIVDDLLATGSTAQAVCRLMEKLGAEIVALCFAIELTHLGGRANLEPYRVLSTIKY
ncbi:MAG: adenine phosphoribosyltransferase [Christensenellales bacterium]|jgi:adenine phosphoribosyltransferase